MARVRFTWNDAFLFAALGYCIVIILIRWQRYEECNKPLQVFLLVDYLTIMLFRISHFICQKHADSPLVYRQAASFFKLGIVFVFFFAWTVVGTAWFDDSKDCLPEDNQKWAFVIWLILCYVWISGYVCILLVKKVCFSTPEQPAQGVFSFPLNLLELEEDVGLSEQQIHLIPTFAAPSSLTDEKCPVCIERFCKDDMCKKLPSCPHFFHAECIDEWLLRKSDCPVCRAEVEVEIPEGNPQGVIPPSLINRNPRAGLAGDVEAAIH